ncbi:MAG: hypothetical protein PHE73_06570 [Sulfurovaceae bacterium]|nr:hypothetical protein [Sulfurovaceae bacterium]
MIKIIIGIVIISINLYSENNWAQEGINEGFRQTARYITGTKNDVDKCWEKYWSYEYKSSSYYHKINNENTQMKKVLEANHINYIVILNTLKTAYINENKEPIKYQKEKSTNSKIENCNNQYENLYNRRNNEIIKLEKENKELKRLITTNNLGIDEEPKQKKKIKIEMK